MCKSLDVNDSPFSPWLQVFHKHLTGSEASKLLTGKCSERLIQNPKRSTHHERDELTLNAYFSGKKLRGVIFPSAQLILPTD